MPEHEQFHQLDNDNDGDVSMDDHCIPLPGTPAAEVPRSDTSIEPPPSHLFAESTPSPDATTAGQKVLDMPSGLPEGSDFAARANRLIDASLNRTPDGGSVIDPDSVLEAGRLYHGYRDGKYYLPNDAAEQDRLDLQNHLFNLLLDGLLYLAPMTKVPEYVLDVATGTGIWALDFAERYPTSQVIGSDLSMIQPDPHVPNCTFVRDDAESEWLFHTAERPEGIKFDFIHLRMVVTCFDDPRIVIKQAFDNMNPGGWIEFQDMYNETGDPTQEASPMYLIWKAMLQGAASRGRDLHGPAKYEAWLKEAGFVDVQLRRLVVPFNPWPRDPRLKEIGLWQLKNMLDGLSGITGRLLRAAGYTEEDADALVAETKDYLRDCNNHAYCLVHVVYGRKPFDGSVGSASAPIEL